MPLPPEILETLPEELHPTLEKFDSIPDLAKSYVEANSFLGRAIRIPGDDAPEEDRNKFLEKLVNNAPELMLKPDVGEKEQAEEFYRLIGKPEAPDKYTRPENAKIDENVEAELRQVFHEANLTNNQFEKVLTLFSEREAQRLEQISEAQNEGISELKGKWGVTYEDRIKAAERMNQEYYPGRDFGEVTPKEMEALYAIHESMTGKGAPIANQDAQQDGMTPMEAEEQMDEIMRKVHNPENKLSHEERMKLIKKWQMLGIKYRGMEGSIDSLRANR